MDQSLSKECFPNWQEFSDWMAKQKELNPNKLDEYLSVLSDPLLGALTSGELRNKPFNPYEYLYDAIAVLKDARRAIIVLKFVSYLISREIKRATTDEYYDKLIIWDRAWEIFSNYVKTDVLPDYLDILIDDILSSDYKSMDIEDDYDGFDEEFDRALSYLSHGVEHNEDNNGVSAKIHREAWLTPSWSVPGHGNSSGIIEDYVEDEYMRDLLHDFDSAPLYTNWLTSKEVVDAVDEFGPWAQASMTDASVYNADDALEDAIHTLFDEHESIFECIETLFFVIFIGRNFESKSQLFKTAEKVLRQKFRSRFPDEDAKIRVGIAHDSEKIGGCDLSLYAFCC